MKTRGNIYLDYNASTPIDPQVVEAMTPYFFNHFGNPSSSHWAGSPAKEAMVQARHQLSLLLKCAPNEIVFTSGGSEANNAALKGVYFALKNKGNHIITSKIEHPSIIEPLNFLKELGAEVTYLNVDRYGRVDPQSVKEAICDQTILISIMHANNEVGTIQPIAEISKIAKEKQILLHTDAAQSIGKISVFADELGVDLLTIAGHKFYAPKGVGVLYVRNGTPIESFIHGANHERGHRAGTENIPYIVALGKAAQLATEYLYNDETMGLRDFFYESLKEVFEEKLLLNSPLELTLPNTLSVNFVGITGEEALATVPTIAASTGAACHSGDVKLSAVLEAMEVPEEIGMGAVRFSLGRFTSKQNIKDAIKLLEANLLPKLI